MNFIYVHAMPAGGKDTQAKRIQESLPDSVLYSPGEIFRQMENPQSRYHIYLDQFADQLPMVHRGEIVEEEKTMQLVAELIDNDERRGIKNFVFTGFPRTERQLELMDGYVLHTLKEKWGAHVNETHIAYIVRESDAVRRAETRKQSSTDGGRKDDDPEVVKRRFEIYKERTYPMLKKLSKEGRLMVIRGDREIEHVREQTEARLQGIAGNPERR